MGHIKHQMAKILFHITYILTLMIIVWELIWKGLFLSHSWIFMPWRRGGTLYDLRELTISYAWIFDLAKVFVALLFLFWIMMCIKKNVLQNMK